MRLLPLCMLVVLAVASAGCTDTAIFVTSTSLGINVDTKPPTAAVAFDRTEAFIGPRSENAGAPPVVASIETAGNVLAPHIRQVYATGEAANIATSDQKPPEKAEDLKGPRKSMVFGTGTTIGFKVGFTPEGVPDSAVFGYRRKEASVIPLGIQKDGEGKETARYPSVLASIDTTSKMKNVSDVGFATKQFFAVGHPAKNLAANDSVRATFEMKALEALSEGQYVRDEASQRIVAYLFPNGRRGADGKPLKPDADRMKQLQAWYEKQPGGENVKFIDFVYDAANADLRKGAVANFKLPPTGG